MGDPDSILRSRASPDDRANRRGLVHAAVAALLFAWAALGAVHTAVALARPEGWRAVRPPGTGREIGFPVPGAAEVTAVAEALDRVPGDPTAPVLLLYPDDADAAHLSYLRIQLNHVAYPRPVEVLDGGRPRLDASAYVAVIVAPGAVAPASPARVVEHRGFVVLLPREP